MSTLNKSRSGRFPVHMDINYLWTLSQIGYLVIYDGVENKYKDVINNTLVDTIYADTSLNP